MANKRRDPERERFWRDTVAAWEKSGQSIRAFCSSRGLSEPSFYSWRQVLRERGRGRSTERGRALRTRRSVARRSPLLVPVRVVPPAVLEVVLPAGVVVRVPA
jgi:transposase-like protein